MKRRTVLVGLLLATLGASAWVAVLPEPAAPEVVDAIERAAAGAASAPAFSATPPPPDAPRARQAWGTPPKSTVAAWSGPPPARPVPPAAASAPVRQAPPRFPYAWIGRLEDGADVQVLLNGTDRTFGARAGDVLDGRWRIERVAGSRLQLRWLPTGETVNVELR